MERIPAGLTDQVEARVDESAGRRRAATGELLKVAKGATADVAKVDTAARLIERGQRLGLASEVSDFIADPTSERTGSRLLERIIASNDLLGVQFLFGGAESARSVGRIRIPTAGGTRLGTGFMVSPRLLMTNNHVIESRSDGAAAVVELDYYTRPSGAVEPTVEFAVAPSLFFVTSAPLDVTIVAVAEFGSDGSTTSERGWHQVGASSGKAVVGERVSIIQHPGGEPQQIAIHQNTVIDVVTDYLHYETDTKPGSSGSPVFNDEWALAALHHASTTSGGRIVNEGVRISRIVEWLQILLAGPERHRLDAGLLDELLDGPPSSAQARSAAIGPVSHGAGPAVSVVDGVAHWTIPLNVSVGLNQAVGATPSSAVGRAVQPGRGTDGGGRVVPPAVTDDTSVRIGLERLANASTMTYYDAAADAADVAAYYADIDFGLGAGALYNRLHDLVATTHHTTLSYKAARLEHLYAWIDLQPNDLQLAGLYSQQAFDPASIIEQEAVVEAARETAIAERAVLEAGGVDSEFLEDLEAIHPFNCEHVVPQSWFDRRKQPKTDLHHLFTCEWGCNSKRSNRAYGEFNNPQPDQCGEAEGNRFEPLNSKGAAARATQYFLLRYTDDIAGSAKEMPRQRLATLLQWDANNPVTLWEQHRNAEIATTQGNRNPFIDHAGLAATVQLARGFI